MGLSLIFAPPPKQQQKNTTTKKTKNPCWLLTPSLCKAFLCARLRPTGLGAPGGSPLLGRCGVIHLLLPTHPTRSGGPRTGLSCCGLSLHSGESNPRPSLSSLATLLPILIQACLLGI